jgi:hypothetical protein
MPMTPRLVRSFVPAVSAGFILSIAMVSVAAPTRPSDPPAGPGALLPMGSPITSADAAVSDQFGEAVALSGDTAVVGAWLEDSDHAHSTGAAYVYRWDGGGWIQVAKLTAPDGAAEDRFGQAVAVHRDVIVVGAYVADVRGLSDAGAAYVFRRQGNDWTYEAKLTADDAFRVDHFGRSVAVSEVGIAVGAPREERPGHLDQGAVYTFERRDGGWAQTAKLVAPVAGDGDWFGYRIAMLGTTLAVGSQCNDAPGTPVLYDAGSVDVFAYKDGLWNHVQLVRPREVALGANFGSSLALSPERMVIGAERDFDNGVRTGAAYVFDRDNEGAWQQSARLVAPQPHADDFFGSGVGVCGDTVVVAAEQADVSGLVDAGSVQPFDYSPDSRRWIAGDALDSGLHQASTLFGTDVAFAGGLLLVSAPFADLPGVPDAGAAFAFARDHDCNADGLGDVSEIALGKVSDVNGDGIPDTCQCLADWDHNGAVNSLDVGAFVNDWFMDLQSGGTTADFDGSGFTNTSDVSAFVSSFFEGCF